MLILGLLIIALSACTCIYALEFYLDGKDSF